MNFAFRYAARSDTGRVRSKNDDSAYAGRYLAVVADGMGGHVGGNVASASTVLDLTPLDRPGYGGQAGTFLADEIQTANIILNQLVQVNPLLAGMGTTCTALLLDGDGLELAHIGDSRGYRLREGAFEQITTDHTFVQRLIEEGRLSADSAGSHPHKNVIMRVLGDTDASPELELKRLDVQFGDRYLLCSDGLSGVVDDATIEKELAAGTDLEEICQRLVNLTLEGGAPDNVTVLVVEVVDASHFSNPPTSKLTAVETTDTRSLHTASEVPETPPWHSGTHDAVAAPQAPPETSAGDATGGQTASSAEERTGEQTPAGEVPQQRVAPWRRRLPRDSAAKLRHTVRHGAFRGDSFSDGVLNAMTQRSGMDLEDARAQEESSAAVLRHELDARPHTIVGAAESATETGAIPTVTDSTVQRRTSQSQDAAQDEDAVEEDLDDLPEDESHPPRIWMALFLGCFVMVLVAGAVWAALAWVDSQYYVGEAEGRVAIYRGVDQPLGPISLSEIEQRTDLQVEDLPDYSQSRVRSGIQAGSLEEAERIVSDLNLDSGRHGSNEASPGSIPSSSSSAIPSSSPSTEGGESR